MARTYFEQDIRKGIQKLVLQIITSTVIVCSPSRSAFAVYCYKRSVTEYPDAAEALRISRQYTRDTSHVNKYNIPLQKQRDIIIDSQMFRPEIGIYFPVENK